MRHPGVRYCSDCPTCGKHAFATRRDAKNAARFLHPEDNMRAYRCGNAWHYGHNPGWRRRGEPGPITTTRQPAAKEATTS